MTGQSIQVKKDALVAAHLLFYACLVCAFLQGCSSSESPPQETLTVNSVADLQAPPEGVVTLREALARVPPGGTIIFDPALNGQTIELSIVGSAHSVLPGEVYAGAPPQFQGYQERDYGRSALYARKDVTIDASDLPDGITIRWSGAEANRARVLAVLGNLTMRKVALLSGYAVAEPIDSPTQPFTLARGGGLAVWGMATLDRCTIAGNTIVGDYGASRDRGTYGGGIYANGLIMNDCIVSGNSAIGYGAAGGGIYSVGGSDGAGMDVYLSGCTVSGNRVTAQHAYGGGIFTLGGGPDNLRSMTLTNSTVARNLVQDNPDLEQSGQYYYRGGGIYMGGGYLEVASCTIGENEVTGFAAQFSGKPNMGGGGVAATIGNAHVVEGMEVRHSIIAGNTLNGAPEDLFSGSLRHFYSLGYNRIGRIDLSQILVPVPIWGDLSRKHWPKQGDLGGIQPADVLSSAVLHPSILSRGPDEGQPVVLWYAPAAQALDQIPAQQYTVSALRAEYPAYDASTEGAFRNNLQQKLRTDYGHILGNDFTIDDSVFWYEAPLTWPADSRNAAWIAFWRGLDNGLGQETLGDGFWASAASGGWGVVARTENYTVALVDTDQIGHPRPAGTGLRGSIGAVEQ